MKWRDEDTWSDFPVSDPNDPRYVEPPEDDDEDDEI